METRSEGGQIAPAGPPGMAADELGLLARALRAVQAAHAAQDRRPAGALRDATFMVEHAGHIIARGAVSVGDGHLTSGEVPRLQPGGYTLTIMAGHGQDNRVLLRESITLGGEGQPLTR
jgi:hypothetical protein